MTKPTAALACLLLAACGGSGSDSPVDNSSPPDPNRVAVTGIWTGKDSTTNLGLTVLIDGTGDMSAIRADGAVYYTNDSALLVSGASVSGTIQGVAPFGLVFADGATHGSGSVTGTVKAMSSLTASIAFTTANGASSTNNVTLSYDSLYDAAPALSSLAGTYTDASGDRVSLDNAGNITFQNNVGCQGAGALHTIQANKSLYQVDVTYGTCTGSAAPLSQVRFVGIAMFDPATNEATAGLHDVNGRNYGLALFLTKH